MALARISIQKNGIKDLILPVRKSAHIPTQPSFFGARDYE